MSFRPLINSVPLDVCLQFISERQYFKVQIKIYHYRLDNFFFLISFSLEILEKNGLKSIWTTESLGLTAISQVTAAY